MSYRLGIDLGFARNRYQEPEVWPQIVREELGIGYVSLVADILNPSWPEDYLKKLVRRTKNALDRYGVRAEACFTSALTRFPHLMHYDAEMRRYYIEWFKRFFSMAAELGCTYGGSHFGIMSFKDYNDTDRRRYILDEAVKGWQELSFFAADLGFKCLLFEPMSVPREMGITVQECMELMAEVDAHAAIPMRVCLDVGHAPHPDERDPYAWIRKLGAFSPMLHLQQTVMHRSDHSPFIEEYNARGIIQPGRVMEELKNAGASDVMLAFEISHKEHTNTEYRILEDLKKSVEYWRPYVKD
jgi:sugar phosphate isomerase/epimerase